MLEKHIMIFKERIRVCNNTYIMRFESAIDTDKQWSFRAGQFINIMITERVFRSYSILTSPTKYDKQRVIELLVRSTDTGFGVGTSYLMSLKSGDNVVFMGAFGHFTIPLDSTKQYTFIATGTGITPFLSMFEEDNSLIHRTKLLYGGRDSDDIYYTHTLSTYPFLAYTQCLSRSNDTNDITYNGRITSFLEHHMADFKGDNYYLCGNKDMVYDVYKQLLSYEVDRKCVFREVFSS